MGDEKTFSNLEARTHSCGIIVIMNKTTYWTMVNKDTDNGCWEWNGARTSVNYGNVFFEGKNWLAHRLSYMWSTGHILLDKDIVLHICDNPPCVNPAHLRKGTMQDNVDDMIAKGRMIVADHRGERNGRAVLTENDVKEVVKLTLAGHSRGAIAKHFGVSRPVISDIVCGNHWRNVVTKEDVIAMSFAPRDKGGHRLREVQIQHGR